MGEVCEVVVSPSYESAIAYAEAIGWQITQEVIGPGLGGCVEELRSEGLCWE